MNGVYARELSFFIYTTSIPLGPISFLWFMAEVALIGADIQEVIGSAIAIHIFPLWAGVVITALDWYVYKHRIHHFYFKLLIAMRRQVRFYLFA